MQRAVNARGGPVQRRNDDEFAAFVAVSHERLRRTAYLICGDWHRASDITQ
jgi:DNA-directed RNA polymerase specialized sigma24 family protein